MAAPSGNQAPWPWARRAGAAGLDRNFAFGGRAIASPHAPILARDLDQHVEQDFPFDPLNIAGALHTGNNCRNEALPCTTHPNGIQ
jgi:hypothetical protein